MKVNDRKERISCKIYVSYTLQDSAICDIYTSRSQNYAVGMLHAATVRIKKDEKYIYEHYGTGT